MGTAMLELDRDIAAYEARRAELENQSMGQWVVFHEGELLDVFPSLDVAANAAVSSFGRGPYLIRQIGEPPMSLPASVVFHLQGHA